MEKNKRLIPLDLFALTANTQRRRKNWNRTPMKDYSKMEITEVRPTVMASGTQHNVFYRV